MPMVLTNRSGLPLVSVLSYIDHNLLHLRIIISLTVKPNLP